MPKSEIGKHIKFHRRNYPRKCFWTQEKETRVKFNPGLRASRPSKNRAQMFRYPLSIFREIIMETVVYGKFLAFTMSGSCNTLINCLITADAWMWNRVWCQQRLVNNLYMDLLDFSWPRLTENFAMDSPKLLHILTTHAAHMNIQWDMEECKCPQVWTAVHRVMPGNWEGGSLIALRQMHTIGRMVVIDTTQGIARYLLLWKYSCLISNTENSYKL